MFALVESGSITKMMNGNNGITIGDNQYSASLFTSVYSEAERNAVGVYTVEIDHKQLYSVLQVLDHKILALFQILINL